ncbi:MAG: DUF559 domain-containing protein [Methylorubrum rhodinum]|uniref:endonuclease domain-containing protein n=1 Tax=Methylorubrum rhodinum TaxID=29428 RepID=UPI003BAEE99A
MSLNGANGAVSEAKRFREEPGLPCLVLDPMVWSKPPRTHVTGRAAANAKTLRRQLTEPEKRLWWQLRHRLPIDDSHFRRQVPIGPYVADFCGLSRRLIIEVDGEQHGSARGETYDAERDQYLRGQGYRVLRFPNRTILREIDIVLDTIDAALRATPGSETISQAAPPPPPTPSPQGGGECAET